MSETIRELTVQLSVNGAASSQKDIQGLQNAVAQADAKFKAAGAGIKNFENTTAGMQAKVAMLSEKMKAQQGVVDKAAATLEKAKAKMTGAAAEQQKLAGKVDAARAAYEKEVAATGKNSAASQALAADLQKLEGQYAAQSKSAQNAAQKVQTSETALTKAQAAVKGTEAELKSANATLQKHGSAWAQAAEKISAASTKFGKKMSAWGRSVTMGITVPVVAAGTAAFKAWETVDDGLDTVIRKTGATGAALAPLEDAYNNVFLGVKATAADAGIAVGEVNTRFKATGTQLEDLSKTFIQFADVNQTDLNESIGKTSKILAQWQQPVSAASGFLGLVTSEAQRTGISVDKLMDSVQTNGATLKGMNLNLSQSVQMMANFEAAGINADTSLAALKKSAVQYTKDGMTLEQGFAMTVKSIQAAKTETEALAIAQTVFGAKGALEMATAIREGRLSVTGLSADMSKMGGVVGKTFAEINGDTANIDRVKNKIISAGASLGKSQILPWAEKAAEKIGQAVDGFSNLDPALQQAAISTLAFGAATGPVLSGIGKIAQGVGALSKLFTGPAGWVTLGVVALAGLGVGLASIKSQTQILDEKMRGVKLAVDTEDIAQITEDINGGIEAAQKVHDVEVSVKADTEELEKKIDSAFEDGKFTKKEYKAASKYVNELVAPDIVEAARIVTEKTDALKAALNGAVNAEGQPITEAEKTALIDQITTKTNTLVTELQTAQADYEALIKEIYNQRKPATDAQIAALDALLAKITGIRTELKLANEDAVNMARADYNKTVSGLGTTENYGGAVGYVQGQQQNAVADAREKLDTIKKTAGAMTDTAMANKLLAGAETEYASAVSTANAEAQKGYQAILDGAAKAEGAGDIIATITQDYDTLTKTMQIVDGLWYSRVGANGVGIFNKDWKTQFQEVFGDGGLGKYLSDTDKIKVSDIIADPLSDSRDYQDLQSLAKGYMDQIRLALAQNVDDKKLNPLLEAVQSMMNSGAFEGLDSTKFEGALDGIFNAFDVKDKGIELGTPIGKDVTTGVAAGITANTSSAVTAVNGMFTAMIAEANRMRPLLNNAMGFVSGGGTGGGGTTNTINNTTTYSGPLVGEVRVSGQADADNLIAVMQNGIRNKQTAYGQRPRG